MSLNVNGFLSRYPHYTDQIDEQEALSDTTRHNLSVIEDLHNLISRELQEGSSIDFQDPQNKEKLDKLYELDFFKDHEKVYDFNSTEELMTLFQDVQTAHNLSSSELETQRHSTQEVQDALMQFHQQVMRIIQMIADSINAINIPRY